MIKSFRLMLVAIVGSILAYYIVTTFLIEISFWKYIIIEFIISFFHAIYEGFKVKERNT